MPDPSVKDVLDILIQERNQHFQHFQQLARTVKVTTLAAVGVALLSGIPNISKFRKLNPTVLGLVLVAYAGGLLSVLWGVHIHNKGHRARMVILERRIAWLVNSKPQESTPIDALRDCGKRNPLLRAEVDDGQPWEGYHLLINGGVAVVAVATVVMFVGLWYAPPEEQQPPDS